MDIIKYYTHRYLEHLDLEGSCKIEYMYQDQLSILDHPNNKRYTQTVDNHRFHHLLHFSSQLG
jgi:hypothetical protein